MRYDKIKLHWFPGMKSFRTGGCRLLLLLSRPPWYSCASPRTWLSPPAYRTTGLSSVSSTTLTHQSQTEKKEEMHLRRTLGPLCLILPTIRRLSRPIYCLFAPLILEWWHCPLYLRWIKTKTAHLPPVINHQCEWALGDLSCTLLWNSVGLCFHAVSNPHSRGTISPV